MRTTPANPWSRSQRYTEQMPLSKYLQGRHNLAPSLSTGRPNRQLAVTHDQSWQCKHLAVNHVKLVCHLAWLRSLHMKKVNGQKVFFSSASSRIGLFRASLFHPFWLPHNKASPASLKLNWLQNFRFRTSYKNRIQNEHAPPATYSCTQGRLTFLYRCQMPGWPSLPNSSTCY